MGRQVCTTSLVVTIICDSLAEGNQRANELAELLERQPGVVVATSEAAVAHDPGSPFAEAALERAGSLDETARYER